MTLPLNTKWRPESGSFRQNLSKVFWPKTLGLYPEKETLNAPGEVFHTSTPVSPKNLVFRDF